MRRWISMDLTHSGFYRSNPDPRCRKFRVEIYRNQNTNKILKHFYYVQKNDTEVYTILLITEYKKPSEMKT